MKNIFFPFFDGNTLEELQDFQTFEIPDLLLMLSLLDQHQSLSNKSSYQIM